MGEIFHGIAAFRESFFTSLVHMHGSGGTCNVQSVKVFSVKCFPKFPTIRYFRTESCLERSVSAENNHSLEVNPTHQHKSDPTH